MEGFGQALVRIRLGNNFRTSKSFFEYLKARGLECNYQYYAKIEKSIAFPSSLIVNQIAKSLDKADAEELIRAFCSEQFKSFDYLFKGEGIEETYSQGSLKNRTVVKQGQRELSLFQVNVLKKKKENYFLFLLLTLSRTPITLAELEKYPNLHKAIKDLEKSGILFVENEKLNSTSSEFMFPKATDDDMENMYRQFDQWDILFSTQFEFTNHINKMMIRRISPRYFGVIQRQIETLIDFVRCSDESDSKHNTEVLHLHVNMSKGILPG